MEKIDKIRKVFEDNKVEVFRCQTTTSIGDELSSKLFDLVEKESLVKQHIIACNIISQVQHILQYND